MFGFMRTQNRIVSLPEFDAVPVDKRPALICRPITAGEFPELWAKFQKVAVRPIDATYSDDIAKLLDGVVIGWQNVLDINGAPLAFDIEKLPLVADVSQLVALASRALDARFDLNTDAEKN